MQLGYHVHVGSKAFFSTSIYSFFKRVRKRKNCFVDPRVNQAITKKSLMRKLVDTNILTGRLRNLQVNYNFYKS